MGYIDHIGLDENDTHIIVDWKSGKSRNNDLQLKLYGLWFLTAAPHVQKAIAEFVYLEQEENDSRVYTRSDIPELQEFFINKIDTIERCEKFIKKPARFCTKYCDYFITCKPFKI